MSINNNNTPYLRKNNTISTLFTLSAIALLLSSPLVLSYFLQPVQAQSTMTFQTLGPASGSDTNTGQAVELTFDAHGTTSTSDPQRAEITNDTIQLQANNVFTGEINGGIFANNTSGGEILINAEIDNLDYTAKSACSSSEKNQISLSNKYGEAVFIGPVECSKGDGGNTAASTVTGITTQDRDSDGILDANDNCPNLSHTRCYKEGDTSLVVHNSHR